MPPQGGGDDAGPMPLPRELTAEAQAALSEAAAARHDWIGEAGRPDRRVIRGDYQRVADFRASVTDHDASLMRYRGGGLDLGYHDHDVVDGGKARSILAALVTPAEVMENLPMLDLLWRVCFRWKLRPRQVTGDTTSGTTEIIVAVEDAGIRASLPLPDFEHRTRCCGRERLIYDRNDDVSRCPGGQELRFRKHKHTERTRVYQASAAACNACVLKAQCTASAKGRQVKRSCDEALLERVGGYRDTEADQKARRKRQVWVEPLFAEGKAWHGLRRFRLRGLEHVNGEALLIAAGQNLKRLLSWRGWGPGWSGRRRASAAPTLSGRGAVTAPFPPGPPDLRARRSPLLFLQAGRYRNRFQNSLALVLARATTCR